jgi:hypothetical protein
MALPYRMIDWPGKLGGDVKGKRFGLVLDIGAGLTPQPAVRAAIEAEPARQRAGQEFIAKTRRTGARWILIFWVLPPCEPWKSMANTGRGVAARAKRVCDRGSDSMKRGHLAPAMVAHPR